MTTAKEPTAAPTQPAESDQPGRRGFYYDQTRCIACRTCELACKTANAVERGVSWRRITEEWTGAYPNTTRTFFSLACMHCAQPACVAACPTGAIEKRPGDGIVLVNRDLCTGADGCRACVAACPYGVPQFGADGLMQKCDYCTALGREPACTQACPVNALRAGTMADLRAAAEGKATAAPGGGTGGPAVVMVVGQ